ncbi:interleukin 21 receptor, tandem duplicate 1 [Halichoeres trimaculatus]|uniref:interleukin 21 receptor, tandem duplicate 1 n=1 Tax=Halichoeres trimaculatus TaxID=147232 RepID=UPI003D9E8426
MAPETVLLLLLLGLASSVYGESSFCNVSCTTDYNVTVNCSCSASLPSPVFVSVLCSDDFELEAHSSCEITPPQSWCVMYPENLEDVAYVGTMCNTTFTQHGGGVSVKGVESSVWDLGHVVTVPPPFDVQVTDSNGFYNITWEHSIEKDCLTYDVRIRESSKLSEEPALSYTEDGKLTRIKHVHLQPGVKYTVDVRAKFDPERNFYWGPWSEWSSSTEWKTTGSSAEIEEFDKKWFLAFLSLIGVLGIVIYLNKTYLQKKLHLITFVPTPDNFFKPLYLNHGGNFKEWVKPAFSEYDYLKISAHAQRKSEMEPDIFQWNDEKRSNSEDGQMTQGGQFLHMLQPPSDMLPFLQDGGSSQSTGHSSGHISINTVTLSGEDEFGGDERSRSSVNTLRSYRDGGSFGSFGDDLEERPASRLDGQSGMLPQRDIQVSNDLSLENVNFEPHAQVDEPERVSLDSFVSHELSEDGYPHVDLDTIDSGFGECSSPGASDSNMAEQMALFQEHKNSNSNYVKQWMFCSTIQEDSGDTENETHEAQEAQ